MLPAEIIDRYVGPLTLLCYLEGEADDDVTACIAAWHREVVANAHDWSLGPPDFIDEIHEGDRTAGVSVQLLPSVDRDGRPMPRVLDQRMLADVEALVIAAAKFTAERDVDLAFELDGRVVGWVEGGAADLQLTEGLLDPWRERARV